MLIENVKVEVVGWTPMQKGLKDKSHWVGREGYISVDVGECMTFEYQNEYDEKKYCRTKKVEEILVQPEGIRVNTGEQYFQLRRKP